MREMQFLEYLQPVAIAGRDRGGRPLADAVHRQHGGFGERRRKKGRRGVALVMLAEQQPAPPVEIRIEGGEAIAQQAFLEQLLLQPDRYRHVEGAEAARREGDIGFDQALEFEKRLVVKGNVIDRAEADAGMVETVAHGIVGK